MLSTQPFWAADGSFPQIPARRIAQPKALAHEAGAALRAQHRRVVQLAGPGSIAPNAGPNPAPTNADNLFAFQHRFRGRYPAVTETRKKRPNPSTLSVGGMSAPVAGMPVAITEYTATGDGSEVPRSLCYADPIAGTYYG